MDNPLTGISTADLDEWRAHDGMPRCGGYSARAAGFCNVIVGKPCAPAEFLAQHRHGRCKRHAASDDAQSAATVAAAQAKSKGAKGAAHHCGSRRVRAATRWPANPALHAGGESAAVIRVAGKTLDPCEKTRVGGGWVNASQANAAKAECYHKRGQNRPVLAM